MFSQLLVAVLLLNFTHNATTKYASVAAQQSTSWKQTHSSVVGPVFLIYIWGLTSVTPEPLLEQRSKDFSSWNLGGLLSWTLDAYHYQSICPQPCSYQEQLECWILKMGPDSPELQVVSKGFRVPVLYRRGRNSYVWCKSLYGRTRAVYFYVYMSIFLGLSILWVLML